MENSRESLDKAVFLNLMNSSDKFRTKILRSMNSDYSFRKKTCSTRTKSMLSSPARIQLKKFKMTSEILDLRINNFKAHTSN